MAFHSLETLVEDLWDDYECLLELEKYLHKVWGFKRKFIKREIYKRAKEKTK